VTFVFAEPQAMATASSDLAAIGSSLSDANAAATASTISVLAAAADEVSAAIAAVFSGRGQGFQALSAQAAAFHEQFVQALTSACNAYDGVDSRLSNELHGVEATEQTIVGDVETQVATDEFGLLGASYPIVQLGSTVPSNG
jgi:hypothetical protein